MELIRTKLTTLLDLLTLKQNDIALQQKHQPYRDTQAVDAYISIKKQINEIIQYIAYSISNSRENYASVKVPNLKPFCSQDELSKMGLIKSNLQDIRSSFMKHSPNLNEIRVEIKALLSSCDSYSKNEQYSTAPQLTTFPKYESNNQYFGSRLQSEQEKTVRIKGYLYKQMNEHIELRNMREHTPKKEILPIEVKAQEYKGDSTKRKKRFNYLQQCQRQIQQIQTNMAHSITTPIKHQPSTPSTSSHQEESDPFGVEISRIPPLKYEQGEEGTEGGLREFLEDSLENAQNAQNLDDSLQLMKKQQLLNKTGSFGMVSFQEKQQNQFSFCQKQ